MQTAFVVPNFRSASSAEPRSHCVNRQVISRAQLELLLPLEAEADGHSFTQIRVSGRTLVGREGQLALGTAALLACGYCGRLSRLRKVPQLARISLRYQSSDVNVGQVRQATESSQVVSQAAPQPVFQHPPRSQRESKKLPFSGDEQYWDFSVFPKALFPWSPEYGGRPWDAWSETHKWRLLFMSTVHLGAFAAPFFFNWGAFNVFVLLCVICNFGITLSYHRQLSHRAFECPKWLEYLLAYFGCLAVEGAPIGWVRMHRYHHMHSDKEDDVHSPMDGFWWSHIGFMLDKSTTEKVKDLDNARDLGQQDFYQLLENAPFYVAVSVVLPIVMLYALGGLPYVLWGFNLRTVVIWHSTWAVNSIGHIWGYQSYKSGDNSQNNWLFGILGFGDGWHNNHHAFPRSCRHGLEWWEFDLNWQVLQLLNACGLAWNLQLPSAAQKKKLAIE